MGETFKIMTFAWNASGLRLCETMSQEKADSTRNRIFNLRKDCIAPNFFEVIRDIITDKQPNLVVMSSEDEDVDNTYFHSELLLKAMPEIGYSLLKKNKLSDVGEVASGVRLGNIPSGEPSGSALRISIYARNDTLQFLRIEERRLNKFFGNKGQKKLKYSQGQGISRRKSGAIASYVWHEIYGKFVFIATDIPSGVDILNIGKRFDYEKYRAASKSANTLFLITLLDKMIDSVKEEYKPDHIFLMGDLNYDIVVPRKPINELVSDIIKDVSARNFKNLQQYDELKQNLETIPLNGFKEGVSNEGPLFMPTWRLARGRSDKCVPGPNNEINAGCFAPPNYGLLGGGIGWHDRILYKELMTSHYITHCTDYNRLDVNNMHASTHAGVLGIYEMRPIS